jgi:hypothetical protein
MSKKFLQILFDEIKIVRIVCRHPVQVGNDKTEPCGAIIEIPLDKLPTVKKCPLCTHSLHQSAVLEDPFILLEKALAGFQGLSMDIEMSFILHDQE